MPISTPTFIGNTSNATALTTSGSSAPAGSLIVVATGDWSGNGGNVTGMSDNAGVGNVYTKAIQSSVNASAATAGIWYCSNSGGLPSGSVITITVSTNTWAIAAAYCTGANGGNDSVANVSANSTTAVTTLSCPATGTLSNANEILFGCGASADANMAGFAAAGFTNLFTPAALAFDYMIVSANTSITLAPTWTNAGRDGIAMAGFMITSSGGGGAKDDIATRSSLFPIIDYIL